ncbi:MAG TPA: hypothetical protein VF520_15845 [Thermoleophilaceae bacterium]|jgi:hypothetical protein
MNPRRWLAGALLLATQLALAAPALASDDGEGLAGETDDKVVTFFALGVILFFVLFVTLATLLQSALTRRKHARDSARARARTSW